MEALHKDDPAQIGPYRTLVRFRETASSVQYLAHAPDGSTALVTRARPELAPLPAFRRQFATEAETGGRLAGGWVQTLLDSRTTGDDLWTARGYVPSLTLGEAVALAGPLPERAVRVLGAALAEALTRVHSTGAVHQGLSADTVLLAADGPRLTAFGALGAAASAQRGANGQLSVTLGYLTPEQASGGRPTPASDVFVLGHLLAYAATGASPFPGVSPFPGGPASATPDFTAAPNLASAPEALRPLLSHCLAASPQARPTPPELAALLAPDTPATLTAQGWLPGRLLTALSTQASAVLSLEAPPLPQDPPPTPLGPPAPGAATPTDGAMPVPRTATPTDGAMPVPRTATPTDGAPPHPRTTLDSAPTSPGQGGSHAPPVAQGLPRRTLLTSLLAGAAGIALGAGTTYALTSNDTRRETGTPAPAPEPQLPGTSPAPLWHYRHTLAADPRAGENPDATQICIWRNQVLVLTGKDLPSTGVDIRTGRVLWTQKSLNVHAAAFPVDDRHCFVVDQLKGGFVWFDARTGVVKRRLPFKTVLGDERALVNHQITAEGPVVWLDVSGRDAKGELMQYVLAYDMAARRELWRSKVADDLGSRIFRPLAVRPEGLLLRDVSLVVPPAVKKQRKGLQHVLLLDRRTGRQLWAKEFKDVREHAGITVGPTGPLFGATGEHIAAFDLSTGKSLWRTPATPQGIGLDPWGFGNGKVHGETLYVGSNQTTVLALDTRTGTQRWMQPTEEPSRGVNAVSVSESGRTVVSLGATQLTAFDAQDGTLRWKFTDRGESVKGGAQPDFPVYSAKIAGRTLLAFRGHHVYALALD
ncbi:PQQ-binding-like beta-propeller repeat protein [Streptomyces sp. NBC_00237]|uniref:outer membrane protein assembly factor BamB family protein n=1 Tax=Streptomyces sp. NBC_00237 TaxID=2975687 RepID=UPI0022589FEE|nr:PQQ-binding-like beta-propeller repeat protein [Streptomyces sp. NBC_00237]MCX5200678.1 PQQ-binding-like beta-propeller repeat protein [Streptomyces sp. NBC_00237]